MPSDLQLDMEIKLPKTRNNYKGNDKVDSILVPGDEIVVTAQISSPSNAKVDDQGSTDIKPSVPLGSPTSTGVDKAAAVSRPSSSSPAMKVGWLKKQGT
jgi:hypothetical protein